MQDDIAVERLSGLGCIKLPPTCVETGCGKRRRHPQVSLDAPTGADADRPSPLERVTNGHAGPDQAAKKAEALVRLQEALGELPEKHRAVFLMARYNEMPYEEIARSLQVPVGTVKSRMNKAVHFLMQAVQDIWP